MSNEHAYLYQYRIVIRNWYDGDTVTVDIDLGFGVWLKKQKLRLYGVDTPELRGKERPEGIRARDEVRKNWPEGTEMTVRTIRDRTGKYGRWLAIMMPDDMPISINEWLVDEGMAEVPDWD